MVMISIKNFSGMVPRVDNRMLPANAAQSTYNAFTDTGKLQALRKAVRDGFAHYNPPVSLFRERTGGWLDWQTNVDVIRSPLDTAPDTLIYTGDGRPKIRAEGDSTAYDLGIPAPVSAPVAVPIAESNSGVINNLQRVVLGTFSAPETLDDGGGAISWNPMVSFVTPMTVTADGEHIINFKFDMILKAVPDASVGDGPDYKTVGLHVYRDGEFLATVPVDTIPIDRPEDIGGPIYSNRSVEFLDNPAAGTYDYKFKVQLGVSSSGDTAAALAFTASMTAEARRNNVTRVFSSTDHHLIVDSRVTLSEVVGTENMPTTVNNKTFTVNGIVSDTVFEIATLVEGVYVSGGKWVQTWNAGEVESRAYRYTYVATINDVDYEGPASEASDVIDAGQGQAVTISGFAAFPGSWNSPASKIRIYRYAASTSTTGQYQFVAEIDIGTTSYTDVILGENLGESLPSPAYDSPNENLSGLLALPNGGAAAFVGKTIYFAEPNFLHAWPAAYARSAHDTVVAMGAFGSSLAVGTKSQPYVLTGTDPANMTMDKVELSQPCLSKAGSVDFGYAWTYPSPDGLVLITTGRAEVISLDLFTEYQWRALNPESFRAARYDNQYVCFYEDVNGVKGGFMFDPLSPSKGVMFLDFWADAIWTNPDDGALYVARHNVISRFDYDTLEMDMRWRSKEFVTPTVSFKAAKVEASKYPVSMSVFCDKQEVFSCQVYSRKAFRIKTGLGNSWSLEVRGQHQIDAIYVAENMAELGASQGGA